MTTIEHVYGRLRDLMTVDFPKVSSVEYKQSVDPFSAELQPRSDLTVFFIAPPASRSEGYVGGAEDVTSTVVIWLSREAGENAEGAAVAVAADLARLRHAVVSLDVDPDQELATDVNIHESVTTDVQPRAEGAVTVVGRCVVTFDYVTDGENP